jgi:beta-1,4-mannosyltransferase
MLTGRMNKPDTPLKIYFSPSPTGIKTNEYIDQFVDVLNQRSLVVNYKKRPLPRSLDILKYAFSSDVMLLNWPEDIVHLRWGQAQYLLTVITLFGFKLFGGKIIWICHNKNTHKKGRKFSSNHARRFFTWIADQIIVHSSDARKHFTKEKKVVFLHHPRYQREKQLIESQPQQFDVLIWGNLSPYKGLIEFVREYKQLGHSYSVKIVGKGENDYGTLLKKEAEGSNISIQDQFLSDNDLQQCFASCKVILLPYLDKDTFSSGALIHSLNSQRIVLGPAIGNFVDINKLGACLVYRDNEELFSTLSRLLSSSEVYNDTLSSLRTGINIFYHQNSWEHFVDQLLLTICSSPVKQQEPALNYY